ncbi:MAG: hypothetical protein RPT12_16985 [Vibrio anguillarum]|nr:hypothetical protein [Vibrio anguillarum]
MILSAQQRTKRYIIDLSGPNGNVFKLLKTGWKWAQKTGLDPDVVFNQLQGEHSSLDWSYEHVVAMFDLLFGDTFVIKAKNSTQLEQAQLEIKQELGESTMGIPNIEDIRFRLTKSLLDESTNDTVTVDKNDLNQLLFFIDYQESKDDYLYRKIRALRRFKWISIFQRQGSLSCRSW